MYQKLVFISEFDMSRLTTGYDVVDVWQVEGWEYKSCPP